MHIENQSIHCMKKKLQNLCPHKKKNMQVVHLQNQEIWMKDLSWNDQGLASLVLELGVERIEQEGSFLLG